MSTQEEIDLSKSGKFTDIEIVCNDNETLYFSKFLLTNSSKYFERWIVENDNSFKIPEDKKLVHDVLVFLMTKEIALSKDNIEKTMSFASEFEIPSLFKKCVSHIEKDYKNIPSVIVVYLCHKYKLETVEVSFKSYYCNNNETITKLIIDSPRFLELNFEHLINLCFYKVDAIIIMLALVKRDKKKFLSCDFGKWFETYFENVKKCTLDNTPQDVDYYLNELLKYYEKQHDYVLKFNEIIKDKYIAKCGRSIMRLRGW